MRCWRIRRSGPWLRANSIQDSTKYPNYQRNFMQFSSKIHWSRSSIDQSTGRPKSNRNCWELQPRISSCDSAPTPAILLHSFDSKGVKTQLQNDWTMMTVKSKHSVSERPAAWQLGLWTNGEVRNSRGIHPIRRTLSRLQSNFPESNISSSNTIVTQV